MLGGRLASVDMHLTRVHNGNMRLSDLSRLERPLAMAAELRRLTSPARL